MIGIDWSLHGLVIGLRSMGFLRKRHRDETGCSPLRLEGQRGQMCLAFEATDAAEDAADPLLDSGEQYETCTRRLDETRRDSRLTLSCAPVTVPNLAATATHCHTRSPGMHSQSRVQNQHEHGTWFLYLALLSL